MSTASPNKQTCRQTYRQYEELHMHMWQVKLIFLCQLFVCLLATVFAWGCKHNIGSMTIKNGDVQSAYLKQLFMYIV